MKKLILFVHGLGGSEETWGDFLSFIESDKSFNGIDIDTFSSSIFLFTFKV